MNPKRRPVSFGTILMLALTVIAIGGCAFIFSRLSGGGSVDLSRVVTALQLSGGDPSVEDIRIRQEGASGNGETGGEKAAAPRATALPAQADGDGTVKRATLTFGGTAAIETEVRRSCYINDSGKYDFSEVMRPLRSVFQADWNGLFLENILSDEYKFNATIVPTDAAQMMSGAGIRSAACGFSGSFDKGMAGIESTRQALASQGVTALGIGETADMMELNGVRIFLREYTATLSASTKKAMAKAGNSNAVSEAETQTIREDIRSARDRGADAVIVLIHWGKDGKNVTKAQRETAREIAEAGADVIIGSGARIPQEAEMISVTGEDGRERSTLCVYSLGTLLSENRKNVKRLGSYLLHLTFQKTSAGTMMMQTTYTPVYIWRYKQDGKFFYRCVPMNGLPPDGMDSEQMKTMEKAGNAVTEALDGSPLTVRVQ